MVASPVERALADLHRARLPLPGERVQVLIDPRDAAAIGKPQAVAPRVDQERPEVIAGADKVLVVAVEDVGERLQGHGGRKRPAWAVPLAVIAGFGHAKCRVPLLRRRGAVWGVEAARIDKLFPGRFVTAA